jgi:hypothetical protein
VFRVIKHAPGAIHVHAAEPDDAPGDAAKGIHQLLRLAAGAENEINDNIKLLPPKFWLMVLKKLAIAKNFFRALGCGRFAAMKNGYVMAAVLKLLRGELSDKAAAADEKYFHDNTSVLNRSHFLRS